MQQFNRERLEDLMHELPPLLSAHYKEVSLDHDIPLDPDWERYLFIEAQSNLFVFTARDLEAKLIGYAIYFVNWNLHYKSSLQAVQDVIYIDKERRGFGRSFIDWCDQQLKESGVQKVYHHVKEEHNFGPMLETLNYKIADVLYARRLDRV